MGTSITGGLPLDLEVAPDSASGLEYLDPSPGSPSWPGYLCGYGVHMVPQGLRA